MSSEIWTGNLEIENQLQVILEMKNEITGVDLARTDWTHTHLLTRSAVAWTEPPPVWTQIFFRNRSRSAARRLTSPGMTLPPAIFHFGNSSAASENFPSLIFFNSVDPPKFLLPRLKMNEESASCWFWFRLTVTLLAMVLSAVCTSSFRKSSAWDEVILSPFFTPFVWP